MNIRRAIPPVMALFIALIASAAPAADSFVSLMGYPSVENSVAYDYAWTEADQTQNILTSVKFIAYPVMGMPAIVQPGDALNVIVKYKNPDYFNKPTDYLVELTTAFTDVSGANIGDLVKQRYTLFVESADWDFDISAYRVVVRIPADIPFDTYNIEVGTLKFSDRQPNAVSVRPQGDSFRMAVFASPEEGNPTPGNHALITKPYPGQNWMRPADSMIDQVLTWEFPFLGPALVIGCGNLIWGDSAGDGNDRFRGVLEESRTAVFLASGDRDGFVFKQGADIVADGNSYFERYYGPRYSSFNYGGLHFVNIDSYEGSVYRRAANRGRGGLKASNTGVFRSEAQAAWLFLDLEAASSDGMPVVVFMHHDPRGPYVANSPAADAAAPDSSQEWNFESAEWDSDPSDSVSEETAQNNTGTNLLALFAANGVRTVFLGHAQTDRVDSFEAAQAITD